MQLRVWWGSPQQALNLCCRQVKQSAEGMGQKKSPCSGEVINYVISVRQSRHSLLSFLQMTLPTLLFLTRAALASPYLKRMVFDEQLTEPGSPEIWSKLIISVFLVLAGGVFAGCVLLKKTRSVLIFEW